MDRLARWNGLNWSGLGGGVERSDTSSASVSAIGARGNDLFATGSLNIAGGKPSFYLARWNNQIKFDLRPMLQLGKARYLANGNFLCDVTAEGMANYVVEGSTNLSSWVPLATNVIALALG